MLASWFELFSINTIYSAVPPCSSLTPSSDTSLIVTLILEACTLFVNSELSTFVSSHVAIVLFFISCILVVWF